MPKKKIKSWSKQEIETLHDLLSKGVSERAISIIMNRALASIQHERFKLRFAEVEKKVEHLTKWQEFILKHDLMLLKVKDEDNDKG